VEKEVGKIRERGRGRSMGGADERSIDQKKGVGRDRKRKRETFF